MTSERAVDGWEELRREIEALFQEEIDGGAPTSRLVVESLSRRVLAIVDRLAAGGTITGQGLAANRIDSLTPVVRARPSGSGRFDGGPSSMDTRDLIRRLTEAVEEADGRWTEPDLIVEADRWLADRIYREADNSCRVALDDLAEHMEKGQTRDDLLRYMTDSSAVEPTGRYRD